MSIEEDQAIKSHHRTKRMFDAIDEAFAKVNAEFDSEENAPSFDEMYHSIEMLLHKVRRLEMDAYITYRSMEGLTQINRKQDHIQ